MKRNQKNIFWWIALVAGLVLVNVIAGSFHSRVDLTEDKRYSLTQGSRELLRNLDEPLQLDVFLAGDLPAEFRRLENATSEFLRVMRDVNPSRIRYRFIDPADDAGDGKSWADSLRRMGIEPINITVQVKAGQEQRFAFPYAIATYNNRREAVELFENSRRSITVAEMNNAEAMMEYQFARSIDQLISPVRPTVVYATGHGEPVGPESYDIVQQLGGPYNFNIFDMSRQPYVPGPDTISALLIVKPSLKFSETDKLKLDQYLMRGGRILWFIDNLHAEEDSLRFKSQLIAYERDLDIQDLLFHYGARINPDLLMDLQCDFLPFAVGGSASEPQYEFLHWNYYPLFESPNNHIINKNLGLVAGRYVNSIDTVEVPGITKTFLLRSSANSRTISTPALISPNENRNTPEDALFKRSGIPAAVLLEGNFTSFFKSRLSRALSDSLGAFGGFREAGNGGGKMIVVSDGDIVLNDVSPRQGPLPMGMNLFTVGSQFELPNANRNFLLNCLEYVTARNVIIESRNKEIVVRTLDMPKVAAEKTKWQVITIAVPVLLVILAGLIYLQLRRARYAPVERKVNTKM
ncbi:MAG TPA: gliding motility-associated ABC transporter substrate-binding protein GldG [Flavisolibacter sp.]